MNETRRLPGVLNVVTDFCFCTLLFSYPLLSFLWRRSYPMLTQEVLCLFLLIAGLSFLFSMLFTRTSLVVSFLLTATLVILSFLIQFNLSLAGMLICFGGTLLLWLMAKQKFRTYCIPVLAALLLGAYLDSKFEPVPDRSAQSVAEVNKELAPVVHILLDGFIGIAGLPDYPASALIRKDMLSFFERNNFELYTHAYTRFPRTGESVYSLMNYRHDFDSTFVIETVARSEHVLLKNKLFGALEGLGYRLNIYQSSHIDLCQSNTDKLDRCWQYNHPNVRTGLGVSDLRVRLVILTKSLLNQSRILYEMVKSSVYLVRAQVAVHEPRLFQELGQDIQQRPMGNYFFAHALIPHSPYIYQADCSVSYAQHPALVVPRLSEEGVLDSHSYEVRNGLYFGQIKCALDTLQALIDSMKRDGIYDRATIILHGDHGSKITRYQVTIANRELMNKQDYRSVFSTLFAVKYPGSEFSIQEQVLPIPYLFEEFMQSLPTYVQPADHYPAFNPSLDASPEKVSPYVYLFGGYPVRPIAIDLFED